MPNYRLNRTHVDASPPPPPPNAALHGKFITLAPLVYENAVFEQLHAASHGDNKRQSVWSFLPYGPFPDAAVMCAYYQGIPQNNDPMFYSVLHTDGAIAGIVSYLRITPPAYSIEIGHIWHAAARQRGRANTEAVFFAGGKRLRFGLSSGGMEMRRLQYPLPTGRLAAGFRL